MSSTHLFDAFDAEVTLNDGRKISATVVAWDEASDLAVLHINMDNLTPIQIGDDKSLRLVTLCSPLAIQEILGSPSPRELLAH